MKVMMGRFYHGRHYLSRSLKFIPKSWRMLPEQPVRSHLRTTFGLGLSKNIYGRQVAPVSKTIRSLQAGRMAQM